MNLQLPYKSFFLFLFIIVTILTTGCSKDEDTPARDKFLGAYSVIETCGILGNDSYDIVILESGADENSIVINNLFDWGELISATVSNDNLTITSQLADGLTFSGNGSLSGTTLTINYTVSDASGSDNCNAICTVK